MELEEYEGGSLSTRRFAIAAWVSIPVAALAFVMAGVSILDILSERPGPGEVPAARPRPMPQAAVTPVAAVLPGVAEGDLLLARLRAEAAAEEARVAALREATEREAALALAAAAEQAAPEPVAVPPAPALLAMAVPAAMPRPVAARPAEPSRPASIPAPAARARAGAAPAGGAAPRPARDRRCGALLARLQLGERPTDGERAFLRAQCGARP
jgi:hypothetical protein